MSFSFILHAPLLLVQDTSTTTFSGVVLATYSGLRNLISGLENKSWWVEVGHFDEFHVHKRTFRLRCLSLNNIPLSSKSVTKKDKKQFRMSSEHFVWKNSGVGVTVR